MFKKYKERKAAKRESLRQEILEGKYREIRSKLSLTPYASEERKYVYMVTPKCACTTVRRTLLALEGHGILSELKVQGIHDFGRPLWLFNQDDEQVKEMLTSPEYFRFSFVRNPYARLLSAWKSKIYTDHPLYAYLQQDIKKALGCKAVSFKHLVEYLTITDEVRAKSDEHFMDQTKLLLPELIRYDKIGRVENFNNDFEAILSQLGAAPEIMRVGKVVTNHSHRTKPMYDQETADMVYALQEPSFQIYGYHKDSWVSF